MGGLIAKVGECGSVGVQGKVSCEEVKGAFVLFGDF